jgi:hypothetical protein
VFFARKMMQQENEKIKSNMFQNFQVLKKNKYTEEQRDENVH